MCCIQLFYTLGSSNEAHEAQVFHTTLFELINSGNSTATGCQHRVNNNSISVHIRRQLAVILHRQQSFFITAHADMTNIGFGNNTEYALHKAQTCTQDRHNSDTAFNTAAGGFAQRSGNLYFFHR